MNGAEMLVNALARLAGYTPRDVQNATINAVEVYKTAQIKAKEFDVRFSAVEKNQLDILEKINLLLTKIEGIEK